jgi:hypothetical protein
MLGYVILSYVNFIDCGLLLMVVHYVLILLLEETPSHVSNFEFLIKAISYWKHTLNMQNTKREYQIKNLVER